jgi:hypothetical protein
MSFVFVVFVSVPAYSINGLWAAEQARKQINNVGDELNKGENRIFNTDYLLIQYAILTYEIS